MLHFWPIPPRYLSPGRAEATSSSNKQCEDKQAENAQFTFTASRQASAQAHASANEHQL